MKSLQYRLELLSQNAKQLPNCIKNNIYSDWLPGFCSNKVNGKEEEAIAPRYWGKFLFLFEFGVLFVFVSVLAFLGLGFFSLLIKSLNAGAISILVNNNESLFSTVFSCKSLSENWFYSNRDLFSQRNSIAFINFVTSHKFHEITLYISLFRSYIWDKLNKPSAYQNARVIIY